MLEPEDTISDKDLEDELLFEEEDLDLEDGDLDEEDFDLEDDDLDEEDFDLEDDDLEEESDLDLDDDLDDEEPSPPLNDGPFSSNEIENE